MNNEEIVKSVSEIRVEGNWREVVDRRKSGWKLCGEIRIYIEKIDFKLKLKKGEREKYEELTPLA